MSQRKHRPGRHLALTPWRHGKPDTCLRSQPPPLQPQFTLPNPSPVGCLACPAVGWAPADFPRLRRATSLQPCRVSSQAGPSHASSPAPPPSQDYVLLLRVSCSSLLLLQPLSWARGQSALLFYPLLEARSLRSGWEQAQSGQQSTRTVSFCGYSGVSMLDESHLALSVCLGKIHLSPPLYGRSKVMSVCLQTDWNR